MNAIRDQRERRGLLQRDLARMLGMQQSQLCKIEARSTNPRADTLLRVADALGCSLDDLVTA